MRDMRAAMTGTVLTIPDSTAGCGVSCSLWESRLCAPKGLALSAVFPYGVHGVVSLTATVTEPLSMLVACDAITGSGYLCWAAR